MTKKPMVTEDTVSTLAPPFKVVSLAEAEQASYVVCCRVGNPRHFDDDVEGTCCSCSHPVFFRPTAPKTPPRLCIECAIDMAGGLRQ
jgi:hypothetical protein